MQQATALLQELEELVLDVNGIHLAVGVAKDIALHAVSDDSRELTSATARLAAAGEPPVG